MKTTNLFALGLVAGSFLGAGCASDGGSGTPEGSAGQRDEGWPVTTVLREVWRAVADVDGNLAIVVGTASAPAQRLEPCEEEGDPVAPGGSHNYVRLHLEVQESLAGNPGDIFVRGGPGYDFSEPITATDAQKYEQNCAGSGVYFVYRVDFYGQDLDYHPWPDILCQGGAIRLEQPGHITEASWADSGGPGWYTAEDIRRLVARLREGGLPTTCTERLAMWTAVTGKPLPAETEACWGTGEGVVPPDRYPASAPAEPEVVDAVRTQ